MQKQKLKVSERILCVAGMFLMGNVFALAVIILFGYFIYMPQEKDRRYPLEGVLYLEELMCFHKPEAFMEEEKQELLKCLKNADAKIFFRKSFSPPAPFFLEKLDAPFYAVEAVIPFAFSHFIFDESGNLVGAELSKEEAETVRRIITEAGARQKNSPVFDNDREEGGR